MAKKQSSEEALNQLLEQILGRDFFDSLSKTNVDSKIIIEKSIVLIKEEYTYALSLQAECAPDAKSMIIRAKRKLDSLESLLTLSKLM